VIEVEECVTQTYEKDGRWWRYCLVCDDGSNKFGKHPRGHATEADAKMSARMHARDKTAARLAKARYRDWQERILDASVPGSDPEAFAEILFERFPDFRWGADRRTLHPFNMLGMMHAVHVDLRKRWQPTR